MYIAAPSASTSYNAHMQEITVHTREEFRAWLMKHHKSETKVAIVLHKKHTGKGAPSHREQIEEAICFGWIDTTIRRIDENTFLRKFSKRNENSTWSDNTLRYAKQLIKEGMMTQEGMRFYKMGLKKPTHDHGIPKNPDMPAELAAALAKNPPAKKSFDALAPSMKRTYYRWILKAKQQETRAKRVQKIIAATKSRTNIFRAGNNAN